MVGDLLDDGYIENLVKQAAEFGGGKIHIIVNNAGFTWDGVIHKVLSLPLYIRFIWFVLYYILRMRLTIIITGIR